MQKSRSHTHNAPSDSMRRLLYHAPEPPIHSLKSFETYLLPCALFSPLPVAATKMDCPPVPPTNKSLNRIHNRLRVATSVCTKHAFTMSDMCWPLIFPIWSPCTACLASSSMPRSRNRQYSVQQGPRENKKYLESTDHSTGHHYW